MATRLELQTKRKDLVAQARVIFELSRGEKREMKREELADFDKRMDEADKLKDEIEGIGGGGARSQRLTDVTNELNTREGRQVAGGQPAGVSGVEELTALRDAPMRFTNDKGQEVRGLRIKDSIRSARTEELPDGICPEELSLGRFLRAAATGDWSKAAGEKRALGGSADVGGGYLVPSILSGDVIDLARNASSVFKAGAITIPMTSSTLSLAKLTQDIIPGWKVENSPGVFADAQFGSVKLQARTLMALASVSLELFMDASNIDQVIETALAKVLALEIDRAALLGDGSAASPTGVRNAQGVTVTNLATNGLTLTPANAYPTFSNGILTILNKNGEPDAVIMAPRTYIELDQLVDTIGDTLGVPPSYSALPKFVTNQIPINLTHGAASTASLAIIGDFDQMLVGMRQDLLIELTRVGGGSTGSAFTNGQIWIRAMLRADVVLAHPEFFCVLDGIL